jgi:hypothetical protein
VTKHRQKFESRKILLRSEQQVATVLALIPNLPLDPEKPLELLVREEVKARKLDQNALMWVGPLADIAEQGWFNGRQYSAEVWHHYFKEQALPEEYDPELCKNEDYKKWDFTPSGERILVGSTTDLTIKGFSQYLEQIHAFGGSIGVAFHANPNEARRAA